MRLWHSKLIPLLDNRRLCDLHMSCCNLRGKGWGKPNKNINYIYDDPLGEDALAAYHQLVLAEMARRKFNFESLWVYVTYCGKVRPARTYSPEKYKEAVGRNIPLKGHTLARLVEDLTDLQRRGVVGSYQCNLLLDSCEITVYQDNREFDIQMKY